MQEYVLIENPISPVKTISGLRETQKCKEDLCSAFTGYRMQNQLLQIFKRRLYLNSEALCLRAFSYKSSKNVPSSGFL